MTKAETVQTARCMLGFCYWSSCCDWSCRYVFSYITYSITWTTWCQQQTDKVAAVVENVLLNIYNCFFLLIWLLTGKHRLTWGDENKDPQCLSCSRPWTWITIIIHCFRSNMCHFPFHSSVVQVKNFLNHFCYCFCTDLKSSCTASSY